jgi:hypothetical protein
MHSVRRRNIEDLLLSAKVRVANDLKLAAVIYFLEANLSGTVGFVMALHAGWDRWLRIVLDC